MKNLCQAVCAAVLARLMVAACHDKGMLEGSRVEYVRVEDRRFEVRVAPRMWRSRSRREAAAVSPTRCLKIF
jgi:hypothetical protein